VVESTPGGLKTCSKCREPKPLSAFGSRGKGRPHRGDCKRCVAQASRDRYRNDPQLRARHKILRDRWRAENPTFFAEYYRANRESMIAAAIQYAKDHPPDPDRRHEWRRSWYSANCGRLRAAVAADRAANPEKYRETSRRGMHRRRARLRALSVEPYTMAQLVERDGTCCVLCNGELDFTVTYPEPLAPTVEHLECISWGIAGDEPSNVALSHWDCNNRRQDKPHPAAARKRAELLAATG
jgi:hypothetical protein